MGTLSLRTRGRLEVWPTHFAESVAKVGAIPLTTAEYRESPGFLVRT